MGSIILHMRHHCNTLQPYVTINVRTYTATDSMAQPGPIFITNCQGKQLLF